MSSTITRIVDNGGQGFLTNTVISQADMDAELDQLVLAVNTIVADKLERDGSQAMLAALPMGGFKITGQGDGTVSTDGATFGQLSAINTALQTELDDTQTGAGLDADGSYTPDAGSTYIPAATSLKNADSLLDDQIKLINDDRGIANGLATLDGSGRVPSAQMSVSAMEWKGNWVASTNTPTLTNGVGTNGDQYKATDTGTVDFGAGNISFNAGDNVIYNGTIWEKNDNTDQVGSVFGRIGTVVAALNDYAASLVDNDSTVTGVTVKNALETLAADIVTAQSGADAAVLRAGDTSTGNQEITKVNPRYQVRPSIDGIDTGELVVRNAGDSADIARLIASSDFDYWHSVVRHATIAMSMSSKRIIGVADPVAATDAATDSSSKAVATAIRGPVRGSSVGAGTALGVSEVEIAAQALTLPANMEWKYIEVHFSTLLPSNNKFEPTNIKLNGSSQTIDGDFAGEVTAGNESSGLNKLGYTAFFTPSTPTANLDVEFWAKASSTVGDTVGSRRIICLGHYGHA